MINKKTIILCFIISFLCAIAILFFIALNLFENKKQTINDIQPHFLSASINENYQDAFCHYEVAETEIETEDVFFAFCNNASFYQPTFEEYSKGLTQVNILMNFINYQNDYTNYFTTAEITQQYNKFSTELYKYFYTMSMGYLIVNVDYITCVTTTSYTTYKSMNPSYSTENNLFLNSLNNNTKKLKFNTYNVKINIFAGTAGDWSTFLWPHAYSELSLILLVESNMSPSTTCHELSHVFGAPDLYSYGVDNKTSSAYACESWDLMGYGYNYESINVHTRQELGWITESNYYDDINSPIEEISDGKQTEFTLDIYPSCTSDTTKTIAYKFGTYNFDGKNEYFILEYRIRNYDTFFDQYMYNYNQAVVIYRVDENGDGNREAEKTNGKAEVVYMGNQYYDVKSGNYLYSIGLTAGSSYGNSTYKKLCYSGGYGPSNIFSGTNSNIVVTVNSTSNTCANVTITFPTKTELSDNDISWDNEKFTYNGKYQKPILNFDTNIFPGIFWSVIARTTVGTYTATTHLDFDSTKYYIEYEYYNKIKNFTWKIEPAKITLKPKEYKGTYDKIDHLKDLTYEIVSGQIFNTDNLNISISIDGGLKFDAGNYITKISATNANYEITLQDGNYIVEPLNIDLSIEENQSSLYGFSPQINYSYDKNLLLTGDSLGLKVYINDKNVGTHTIKVEWANKNYKINYNDVTYTILENNKEIKFFNGDDLLTTIIVPYNDTFTYTGETPKKQKDNYKEYQFAGWKLKNLNSILTNLIAYDNLNLYASFTEIPIEYCIKLIYPDSTTKIYYSYQTNLINLPTYSQAGYDATWKIDNASTPSNWTLNEIYQVDSSIEYTNQFGDVEFKLVLTPKKYTFTFFVDNNIFLTLTVVYNQQVDVSKIIGKKEKSKDYIYKFVGWQNSQGVEIENVTVINDLQLYANFEEVEYLNSTEILLLVAGTVIVIGTIIGVTCALIAKKRNRLAYIKAVDYYENLQKELLNKNKK